MKTIVILCVTVMCGLLGAVKANAQIQSVSLKASGLTCSMCSKAIYKSLGEIPAVSKVDVDIENSTYQVSFKPEAAIRLDDLKNAVKNAGFSVASMEVKAKFDNTSIYDDAHVELSNTQFHFVHVPKKTLNGEATLVLLDKDYLPEKERKKYAGYTQMDCFQTGKMNAGTRIYHVTVPQS